MTILQLQVLVAVLLARTFSPLVAALVVATFVAYVSWTTLMTQVWPAVYAQVSGKRSSNVADMRLPRVAATL